MKKNYLALILIAFLWACGQDTNTSDAYGNFEANSVIVSSETNGKVIEFGLKQGTIVKTGAIVAVIDTIQILLKQQQLVAQKAAVESKRSSIQAQIEVFQEQIKNLKTNETRVRNMLNDGASTQKQLDDITGQISVVEKQITSTKTQFTAVSKEVDVIKTQAAALEDQLQRCFVKNPVKGTVLETFVEEGEITGMGRALYKIANIDELTLKVYISGDMLPTVKVGRQVKVIIDKDKTENQTLTGTVSWVSPEAEFTPKIIQTKEERVKLVYAVKVAVKNDGRLKIGMPGEVSWQ